MPITAGIQLFSFITGSIRVPMLYCLPSWKESKNFLSSRGACAKLYIKMKPTRHLLNVNQPEFGAVRWFAEERYTIIRAATFPKVNLDERHQAGRRGSEGRLNVFFSNWVVTRMRARFRWMNPPLQLPRWREVNISTYAEQPEAPVWFFFRGKEGGSDYRIATVDEFYNVALPGCRDWCWGVVACVSGVCARGLDGGHTTNLNRCWI